ncbi:small, acid-soluble spore protein L [Virgibacillus halophilus]
MPEKNDIWSKKQSQSSVTPQGLSEEETSQRPQSQLEQRAKKKNTKL